MSSVELKLHEKWLWLVCKIQILIVLLFWNYFINIILFRSFYSAKPSKIDTKSYENTSVLLNSLIDQFRTFVDDPVGAYMKKTRTYVMFINAAEDEALNCRKSTFFASIWLSITAISYNPSRCEQYKCIFRSSSGILPQARCGCIPC